MKVWDVDLVLLAEVCVAWEDKTPRRVIRQITQNYMNNGCWTVASSKVNVKSYIKPGGTGVLSWGRSNGTIIDRGVDKWQMGRWSYVLIAGKKEGTELLV